MIKLMFSLSRNAISNNVKITVKGPEEGDIMDKADKKLIIILLIIIIIGSIILSIEILSSRKYDEQLYNEIYDEYNEIFGDSNINENIQENKTNSDSKKQIIYICKKLVMEELIEL